MDHRTINLTHLKHTTLSLYLLWLASILSPIFSFKMPVMAWKWWITLNPNTGEAEAGWCLSLRPTWPIEFQDSLHKETFKQNQTINEISVILSLAWKTEMTWKHWHVLTLFTSFIDEFLFIFRFMLLGFYFIFLVSFVLMWQTVLCVELCSKPSTLTFPKAVVEKPWCLWDVN